MQSVAQAWLVYRLTGSTVLLGLISFSGQIPVFLLASTGGAIADKYNRQRILQITQTTAIPALHEEVIEEEQLTPQTVHLNLFENKEMSGGFGWFWRIFFDHPGVNPLNLRKSACYFFIFSFNFDISNRFPDFF